MFNELSVSAASPNMAETLQFDAIRQGQSRSGAVTVDIDGRLGDLLSDAGDWNYARSSMLLNADLKNVPAALLGAMAGFGSDYNDSLAAQGEEF